MSKYFVELPGTLSLEKQSRAIEGEEALGTRFLGARIWVNNANKLSNLAEFQELEEEPDPPLGAPRLTTTLADGVTPEWTGQLIVQGAAKPQVFLTRVALQEA